MVVEIVLVSSGALLLCKRKPKNNKPSLLAMQVIRKNRVTHKSKPVSSKKTAASSRFKATRLMADLKSVLVGDERRELQKSISSEIESADKEIRIKGRGEGNSLFLSVGAIGLSILGTVSAPFYLLGSAAVLYLARNLYKNVWRDLKRGHIISLYLLASILTLSMILVGQLFYSAVAGIFTSYTAKLIDKAEDSSQKKLINVFSDQPKKVWLFTEGVEVQVDFESIKKGDIVIAQAGEVIPVDGIIQAGSANIDQHILTGESQPVDRGVGEQVFAATLILAGRISICVEVAGEETVAANIGNVLNNTKTYKDQQVLRGRKIAEGLMPVELGASLVTWGLLGPVSAVAVLWSGLGYRMMAFGPISVLNYLQILSRCGILVKDGRVLESIRNIDTVVFDKTGTLTEEQPGIGRVHLLAEYSEAQVLYFAASAEHRQTHPIAKAIIAKAQTQGVTPDAPLDSSYEVGYGIKVTLEQGTVRIGSRRFMQREGLLLSNQIQDLQQQAAEQGHSLIYVGVNDTVAGVFEMQPTIRPEAYQLVQNLKKRGITPYIISGDHEKPTRNIAQQLGIEHYFAETLPENKADLVNQLRDEGRFVCFIGDGINDAIALKAAHVSISLKGASSAATDTAQIIFMDGTLASLEQLFELTKDFEHTMKRNMLISVVPGAVNITGIYMLSFGIVVSIGLFYAGTILGLANTVMPLIKHQNKTVANAKNLKLTQLQEH